MLDTAFLFRFQLDLYKGVVHQNHATELWCYRFVPPVLLLQPEVQRWPCLRWICLLGKRGKVPFLTWTPFTEPCSTRSLPLERSRRSQSRCRKSLRTNRIGGRGGVKSTMID